MSTRELVVALRTPGVEDIRRVAQLVEATGLFRPQEVDIAVEVFGDAARQPGADYHAIGAFDDEEELVGFVCYGPAPGTEGTWDLYWIVVDPRAQRQGIGTRLSDACEAAVRRAGGRMMVIETSSRPDYAATRGFYSARGYRRAARVADYYAPGDDLLVYTKALPPSTDGMDHG